MGGSSSMEFPKVCGFIQKDIISSEPPQQNWALPIEIFLTFGPGKAGSKKLNGAQVGH